jgi:FtsH-binding integral membrane protein
MSFAASARPIRGAVATLGVSDRVSFLRRTYAHLGGALLLWPLLTAAILKLAPSFSYKLFEFSFLRGNWNWLLVIGLFMGAGYLAQRLANAETSRGLQYLGLGIEVAAWSLLLQPILWLLMLKFGDRSALFAGGHLHPVMTGQAMAILMQAMVLTLTIFLGLTLTVFLSKKDFSFMRGILSICSFAALGVILASMLFGFSLGAVFCGAMILLMAGYILYAHVAAALMLFSTVATLFWYVLNFLMSMRRD